jgi:hypothetical protein
VLILPGEIGKVGVVARTPNFDKSIDDGKGIKARMAISSATRRRAVERRLRRALPSEGGRSAGDSAVRGLKQHSPKCRNHGSARDPRTGY